MWNGTRERLLYLANLGERRCSDCIADLDKGEWLEAFPDKDDAWRFAWYVEMACPLKHIPDFHVLRGEDPSPIRSEGETLSPVEDIKKTAQQLDFA